MTALAALLAAGLFAADAPRAAHPSELCLRAANRAADRHGVPRDVLAAIALTETGTTRAGRRGPWPWTLNIEGAGRWFDSRAEALAAAEAAIRAGRVSTDLGCFQINFRWHGSAFAGPEEMLDPAAGADYAARFLADLHAEAGDWTVAAGWYHSRTPSHARRYRAVFTRARAEIGRSPPAPAAPAALPPAAEIAAATPGGVRLSTLRAARGGLFDRR